MSDLDDEYSPSACMRTHEGAVPDG